MTLASAASQPALIERISDVVRSGVGQFKTQVDDSMLALAQRVVSLEEEALRRQPAEVIVTRWDGQRHQVTGAHPALEEVLQIVGIGETVLLVGPAGCGKTHLGEQVAKALGLEFGALSCTAGMTESQILGRREPADAGGFHYVRSPFVQAFEEGGVFLFDEVDALDPNVLLCVNSALANGFIQLPNRPENPRAQRHPEFVCILAANTYGTGANRQYCGRNQLDAASLDRFVVVSVDYSRDVERALCPNEELLERFWRIRERVVAASLRRVVSTRFIQRAYKLRAIGWDVERIEGKLFEGWSRDEIRKVTE